jgi:transposase
MARPTRRFVAVKSAERQAARVDHKTRDFFVRQRTLPVNTIRAHLSEVGIVVAKGMHGVERPFWAADELPAAAQGAPRRGRLIDVRGDAESGSRSGPI